MKPALSLALTVAVLALFATPLVAAAPEGTVVVSAIAPTFGPTAGGTSVTITGANFAAGATVALGGSSATSVQVVDSSTISAVTGPHTAATVDVVVTVPTLAPATLPSGYTYTDTAPPPSVTSVTPNAGPTAGGTQVGLAGSGFTGATAVTFGDTAAASFAVTSETALRAVSPPHAAGTVHVTVTTPGGTSTPGSLDQFTFTGGSCSLACTATVPATAAPNVPVNFQATATSTGCSGSPSYSWTFGDSQTSTEQDPSHAYASPGVYAWTLTVSQDGQYCQKYGSLSVTAPPTISSVQKLGSPFRLKMMGGNFHQNCTIKVNGQAVPQTVYKNANKAIAMKGAPLKAMCPLGQTVQITMTNNDDGGVSAPYPFTP